MALNPEISLGVRPPAIAPLQIQDPLQQYAKAQTLRNLMTQGQIGQLNVEQTQLENQALQEKQRRTNAVADLFTKGRPTEDLILSVGGPEAAAALKGLHDSDKAKFEVLEATNKAITRTALGIKALPPEKRDFAYRAERARLLSANPALANQMPEQYDESYVDAKIQEGTTADQYFANVRADAKAKLEAPGVEAENQRKMAEAEQKQRQVEVSRLAPALKRGAVAYQQALAEMDPKRAALYGGFRDPLELYAFGTTPHEQITAQQAAANAAAPNKPPALMPPDVEEQQTRLRMASAPKLLTPAEEAQRIRVAAAAADAQPATEAENRSLGFYDRSASADKTLEGVRDYISDKSTAGMWLTQTAPNSFLSKEEQSYMQGARQFINAYLRRDSGAAIQPSEWAEAYKTFLPYPGDKPDTLALKARERKVIIDGLKTSAARAYTRKYGEGGSTPPNAAPDKPRKSLNEIFK